MQLIRPLLFNPTGDDSLQARELINGNCTNVINLNNVKYKVYYQLYDKQLEQFWIPKKVDLTNDRVSELTDEEYRAYKGILSFLTFLDSIQVNNLPNVADWLTAPEAKMCLSAHDFYESIHTAAYQYIFESTISSIEERQAIYDYWREDPILLERNSYIAQIYQDFLNDNTKDNFDKMIIADYLLEGLYFYQGFCFFYNLASRKKMTGVSSVIRYINKDELLHVAVFANLIRDLEIYKKQDLIYEMFDFAVRQEIKWNQHILVDILGITGESIVDYTYFLANKRLIQIGLEPQFKKSKNPYRHLEKIAGIEEDNDSVKSNFFETTVTGYNMASAIRGWDEI